MSDAAPPDGSDPRVLTPGDDEPEVWVASGETSNSKKYHTNRCATVERMTRPTKVPMSIAEWRDHTLCDRCRLIDTNEDYRRPGTTDVQVDVGYHTVTPLRCLILRALALEGYTQREAADEIGVVTKGTAGKHIAGSCQCSHYGHSVEYDDANTASPAGDGGVPDALGGQVIIPPTTCARMRRIFNDAPVSPASVAALYGTCDTTVRRHAKNTDRCQHDLGDAHPPVRYNRSKKTWEFNR